ncbi:hypothetical protein [Nonlabens ulvanivorans]|uniref:TonB family protein n=1 Tax=Nonlabens ulvanivorans TaxID=906888 RepID=A0A084JWQ9_NONUL|nr:hypothetical protein [Nonlabens ulvanivorans]KEZ93393.1 hypothetical protein IL45_04020 [Nonlabens ulvanivorans]PRX13978.1 hypothetical protein LY02_01007 [Nonlabens ulvanivorans]
MNNRINGYTESKFQHLIFIATILMMVVTISCKEASQPIQTTDSEKNTASDLITKINAVQEQIMVQGNISEDEEQALLSLCSIVSKDDGMAVYTSDDSIILKDVEMAPVYDGCENLPIEETKACFDHKISAFVKREFNLSISKDLNLTTPKKVEAFFIIDENGDVTGMKVRDSEVNIQAEILRVLRKIPVMEPATQNGNSVSVLCSIVITYGNDIDVVVTYIPERPN